MSTSVIPGPLNPPTGAVKVPARTPGPLGINDQADTGVSTRQGDTAGTLGIGDHADPAVPVLAPGTAASGAPAKLADGTAVSPGADGKAAKATCPLPLAARADTGQQDVDWAFISAREGGSLLDGYVPAADKSKSGVTVGTGVDLGARSEADIDKLSISADLKTLLKPYCGKQAKAAADYLKEHPLKISDADATALDKAIKQPSLLSLIASYNAAVDAANAKDKCARVAFEKLPQSVQTALASVNFQYGSMPGTTPAFWKQITEQRWADASANLKSFGDAYPTRRKLEAGLIDAAISAAPKPVP